MKPIPLSEQEYRNTLHRLERRAIIPLKWGVLLVTLILWIGVIGSPPSPPIFLLFLLYFLFNSAQSYFFYVSRVTLAQIKPFTLVSYLVDVIFVSMLIYFDLATTYFGPVTHHEFYLIYFLLVMRGFALFKTLAETIFVNLMISALYMLTFYLQSASFQFLLDTQFAVSMILIWTVILMAWIIVSIINRQKLELLEVHDRLLRADGLARVGELAAGVAHEINNPIGIISATAEYLQRQTPEGDPRREDIDAIHAEALRCKQIVSQMLTYARPRAAGLVDFEPAVLNDEVLNFVFPRSRTNRLEVIRDYAEPLPLVHADPNLFKQALLNLYVNARQAMRDDQPGRIVARMRGLQAGRPSIGRGRPILRIDIEDNGMGIPEQEQELIFNPFFTRKEHGTGLGLAVTQRIIESFGGSISVRSKPGEGATFTIDLPGVSET